jgi:hypothetical protein
MKMLKAKSSSAEIQHLRSALLRDGMTSYPLAMTAIAEFRHEVFSILERVAKPREKDISQVVGDVKFKRDSHEVDDFLDGSDTWLAVLTNWPCSFQIYVSWKDVDSHPGPVRISACIYFDKRAMFEKVDKALQDRFGSKFTTDDKNWGCYLEESIEHQQAGQLESALGKISDKWIKMLGTVNVRKLIRSKQ